MRIKDGFILHRFGAQYVVAAVGKTFDEFKGIIRLNETGAFLWECLCQGDMTNELLTAKLTDNYEIDSIVAGQDVDEFIEMLEKANLIEN